MLTQHSVRTQLDTIAEEILRLPGIYSELYTRLFSRRVRAWMRRVPRDEARVIEAVAELDPDYCPEVEPVDVDCADVEVSAYRGSAGMIFNPAWDVQY